MSGDASRQSVTHAHDRIDAVEQQLEHAASIEFVRHLEERIRSLEDARTAAGPDHVPSAAEATEPPGSAAPTPSVEEAPAPATDPEVRS